MSRIRSVVVEVECAACNGKGRIKDWRNSECVTCRGQGTAQIRISLDDILARLAKMIKEEMEGK